MDLPNEGIVQPTEARETVSQISLIPIVLESRLYSQEWAKRSDLGSSVFDYFMASSIIWISQKVQYEKKWRFWLAVPAEDCWQLKAICQMQISAALSQSHGLRLA